jgi:hypothetical protein
VVGRPKAQLKGRDRLAGRHARILSAARAHADGDIRSSTASELRASAATMQAKEINGAGPDFCRPRS